MIWGVLGGIFLSLLVSLLASELYDSCPRLTNLLLRAASRRLPAECRDRYWEEWTGEWDAQRDVGKLWKLSWALWVFLSSWQTGRTLQSAIAARQEVREEASKLLEPPRGNSTEPPVVVELAVGFIAKMPSLENLSEEEIRETLDAFLEQELSRVEQDPTPYARYRHAGRALARLLVR